MISFPPDNGILLHVGCGQKSIVHTPFSGGSWREVRYDIDPAADPDYVGSITNMSQIDDAFADAIFSSHNIEHLYPHQVDCALGEFRRVLKPNGFALVTCPDLRSIAALVAEGKLEDPAYVSPAGPISPIDMLFGHRRSLLEGNLYMAHRTGFTEQTLTASLLRAGFARVASMVRPSSFDLWALAVCSHWQDDDLRRLSALLMPVAISSS